MNRDDDAQQRRELLEFGTGGSETGPGRPLDTHDDPSAENSLNIELGRVDDARATEPVRHWSWRGVLALGLRVDRSRAFLAVSALVTVTALNVALVGWATRSSDIDNAVAAATQRETHGLTENQAACFAFSRAEARVAAVLGAASPVGVGPERGALRREVRTLDGISHAYPDADYRLIVAFHEVGNSSVKILTAGKTLLSTELQTQRFTLLVAARDACAEIGSFDTRTSTPLP
jgi:hypothetical protein